MRLLSASDLKALRWAVKEAEGWRGTLTGNQDHGRLEEFDRRVKAARTALNKVREIHKNQREEL